MVAAGKSGENELIARQSPLTLMIYHGNGRNKLARHLQYLDSWVMRMLRGDVDWLFFLAPPRHAKSTYCSVYLPAWWMGRFPEDEVMLCSYGTDHAAKYGRLARDVIFECGRAVFGLGLDKKRQAETDWCVGGTGLKPDRGMYAQGLDGQITGKGANLLILNDLYKTAQEAKSEGFREQLIDFLERVAFRAMYPGAKMVVEGYRWNQRDIQAWMMERAEASGAKVKVIRLPAIAEEGDELGRKPGEALWPSRFPLSFLEQRRREVGKSTWSAQFQQTPIPGEGELFDPTWWQYWGPEIPAVDEKWLSLDCAFKEMKDTDFVVAQIWGRKGEDYYLLDQARARTDFVGTLRMMVGDDGRGGLIGKWKPRFKMVEDKANGPAVISALRNRVSGFQAVNPKGGKESRASAISPLVEEGRVWIPQPEVAPWVTAFEGECAAFPNGQNDDQVDAMTQALARFAGTSRKEPKGEKLLPEAIGGRTKEGIVLWHREMRPARKERRWEYV